MAFVDSVMLAVQLNVTLVLPKFYKHYEYLAASQEQDNQFWTQVWHLAAECMPRHTDHADDPHGPAACSCSPHVLLF